MEHTLRTMRNEHPEVPIWVENQILLPRCCPVSGNPQPGSTLRIRYRAAGCTLEVYSLERMVHLFVDGHPDGTRNMEAMLQKIAGECAAVLGVKVTVRADLVLQPEQRMTIIIRIAPDDLLSRNPSPTVAPAVVDPMLHVAPSALPAAETAQSGR